MSPDKRTLDELIDDLPDDLKRVIVGELLKNQELPTSPKNKSTLASIINRFSAMISKTASKTAKPRLSQVNKEFRDKHSYYERIMKIPFEIEKKETYKTKTQSVVKAIGNISLKKLTDFDDDNNRPAEKIHNHLEDLFYYANLSDIYNDNPINLRHKTYAEAKKQYANLYPESNFEDKVKEWNDMWNYSHSSVKLKEIQSYIKNNKKYIIKYEPEKIKENTELLNSFLKLDENISYGEYIRSIKKLPIGAKAHTGLTDLANV
jgi:hypothetical protein